MSVVPDMGLPNTMSEVEYDALPEGVARRIEVVHGYVLVCESPTPQHQQVARQLANAFEAARPKEPSADGDIIDAREFHLDAATYQYRVETLMEHGVVLSYPFKVAVPFEELVE